METPNSSGSEDEREKARTARRRAVARGSTAETADVAAVERLVEMGFDRHWCEAALEEANDFDQALAVLLAGGKRGAAAEAPHAAPSEAAGGPQRARENTSPPPAPSFRRTGARLTATRRTRAARQSGAVRLV